MAAQRLTVEARPPFEYQARREGRQLRLLFSAVSGADDFETLALMLFPAEGPPAPLAEELPLTRQGPRVRLRPSVSAFYATGTNDFEEGPQPGERLLLGRGARARDAHRPAQPRLRGAHPGRVALPRRELDDDARARGPARAAARRRHAGLGALRVPARPTAGAGRGSRGGVLLRLRALPEAHPGREGPCPRRGRHRARASAGPGTRCASTSRGPSSTSRPGPPREGCDGRSAARPRSSCSTPGTRCTTRRAWPWPGRLPTRVSASLTGEVRPLLDVLVFCGLSRRRSPGAPDGARDPHGPPGARGRAEGVLGDDGGRHRLPEVAEHLGLRGQPELPLELPRGEGLRPAAVRDLAGRLCRLSPERLSPGRGRDRRPPPGPDLRLGRGPRPHGREPRGRARRVPLAPPPVEPARAVLRRRRPARPARRDAAAQRGEASEEPRPRRLALWLAAAAAGAHRQSRPATIPPLATRAPPPSRAAATSTAWAAGTGWRSSSSTTTSSPARSRCAPTVRSRCPWWATCPVGGATLPEIGERLTTEFARYVLNPRVDVVVREYNSRFVALVGEVPQPGRRALGACTRVIDVLLQAGGFRDGASAEVVVSRGETDGESLRARVERGVFTPEARRVLQTVLRGGEIVTVLPPAYVTVQGEVHAPESLPDRGPPDRHRGREPGRRAHALGGHQGQDRAGGGGRASPRPSRPTSRRSATDGRRTWSSSPTTSSPCPGGSSDGHAEHRAGQGPLPRGTTARRSATTCASSGAGAASSPRAGPSGWLSAWLWPSLQTPQYQASTMVRIDMPTPLSMSVSDAFAATPNYWQYQDFYATEFRVLASPTARGEGCAAPPARGASAVRRARPSRAGSSWRTSRSSPSCRPAWRTFGSRTRTRRRRPSGPTPWPRSTWRRASPSAWTPRARPTSGSRSVSPPPSRACVTPRRSCWRATSPRTC